MTTPEPVVSSPATPAVTGVSHQADYAVWDGERWTHPGCFSGSCRFELGARTAPSSATPAACLECDVPFDAGGSCTCGRVPPATPACPSCHGTGADYSEAFTGAWPSCPDCDGTGLAPSPASPAEPAEEREHLETIQQRDDAEEWADRLAAAVAERLGVEVGEHSSANNPWQNALDHLAASPAALDTTGPRPVLDGITTVAAASPAETREPEDEPLYRQGWADGLCYVVDVLGSQIDPLAVAFLRSTADGALAASPAVSLPGEAEPVIRVTLGGVVTDAMQGRREAEERAQRMGNARLEAERELADLRATGNNWKARAERAEALLASLPGERPEGTSGE